MNDTTTKVTQAQANLLVAVAKANSTGTTAAAKKGRAPAPVAGRYARARNALVAAGLLAKKGDGYVVTRAGHKAIADSPAKPAAKAVHADVPVDALTGEGKARDAKTKAPANGKAKGKATTKAAAKAPTKAAPKGHPGNEWMRLVNEAGTTRMAVAKEMGIAPMSLHRYIVGEGVPTARVTILFAQAVGADAEALWRGVCEYKFALAKAEVAGK